MSSRANARDLEISPFGRNDRKRKSWPSKVYLDDDEYAELQQFLMEDPEAGSLVPGSGGVRKIRWKRPGMGKRGGVRLIYFVRYDPNEIWMLTIYAKARSGSIPAHILKALKERFENEP